MRLPPKPTFLITLAATAALTARALAQCEPQRFWPDFEPRPLEFGVAVAISDEHLLVVDRFADKVYTYRKGNGGDWVFNHTVPGASGGAIQIEGDRFITGSLGVERYGGAIIYAFADERWAEVDRLESPDSTVYASSGYVVALRQDIAAFANWGTRVAVFSADSTGRYELLEELRATVSQVGGVGFGNAIVMDDRFLIVGAPIERLGGIHNGVIYVYEWDADGAPVLVQRIESEPSAVGPRLGASLAMEGDTLVAGAWGYESTPGETIGAAYVYELYGGQWQLSQRLLAPAPVDGAYFGCSVAIEGGVIAVAAQGERSGGDGRGTVHLYRPDVDGQWRHASQVTVYGAGGLNYGQDVDLGGGQLVVGGRDIFHMGEDQGVADVYDLACLLCPPRPRRRRRPHRLRLPHLPQPLPGRRPPRRLRRRWPTDDLRLPGVSDGL